MIDAAEYRSRCKAGPDCENLIERDGVDLQIDDGMDRESFDLRAKDKYPSLQTIKQWPNAQSISRDEEFLLYGIPDRDGELAIEALQTTWSLLLVEVQKYFRIAMCLEVVPVILEFEPQLAVVEDLTIVDNPETLVFGRNGLLTGREIDNAQPRVCHADRIIHIDSELVRPAVSDHGEHLAKQVLRRSSSSPQI